MVKGWILDLPIIPQPIVFLCIVLAAQPTLSWSLSDLDQWAHFSQYLGLCQQKLHILIVMCCKHHESRMKRIVYVRLRYMEAFKLLNEHGTKGGHARLTEPSPPGQFGWLAMMKNAKGPKRPFTMRLLYNAPCGRWPIDHGLCRSQTMLNKRQGKPDQDFHCSQKQSITSPEPDKHFHVQYLFETTLHRVWVINTGHKPEIGTGRNPFLNVTSSKGLFRGILCAYTVILTRGQTT